MAKLKITQVRSKNGETKRQIANLRLSVSAGCTRP